MPIRPPIHQPQGWKSPDQRKREADAARPPSSQRGYGAAWRAKRDAYLAAHPWCELAGCGKPATHVDHRVALASGGADDASNYQALCHGHHSSKTARHDGGFGNARDG
ncbi:MAG: HNH endonuclease [Stellaceae bacterium]